MLMARGCFAIKRVVSALIDSRKTDINYFCENSYPAIFSAIDSRDDQIVRIITKSERFDVNAKGHMDQKPLRLYICC